MNCYLLGENEPPDREFGVDKEDGFEFFVFYILDYYEKV